MKNGINIAPCKGCDKRHVGCHDDCQPYKDWSNFFKKAVSEERVETVLGYSQWLKKVRRRGNGQR